MINNYLANLFFTSAVRETGYLMHYELTGTKFLDILQILKENWFELVCIIESHKCYLLF